MSKIIIISLILLLLPFLLNAEETSYQGELITPDNSSAVYYIGKDSKKYIFLNIKTYSSWFDNFDNVKPVSSDILDNYEYNGIIRYKPGIYNNLNNILPTGTIVHQINSPGYYYIDSGKKRVFTTIEAFEINGYSFEDAIITDISDYEYGFSINSKDNNLISFSKFSKPFTRSIDTDNDNLSDYDEEYIYYTDLNNRDTDNDGIIDGEEIQNNNSPNHANKRLIEVDSDNDYLNDYWEIILGTDLMNPDSDKDLYLDGTEVAAGYNPLDPTKDAKSEKLIKIDLDKQHLEYHFDNKLFGSFPVSSGIKGMETPIGEFEILGKEDVKRYGGPGYDFDYPDTKWNLHFTTQAYRYYIHGAYWHNNFGHKMSHGCVNVSYENMEPLYWWTNIGTKVIIE